MANPIKKDDLISDDALKALEEMSRLLREDKENLDALMATYKQYAGVIQTSSAANSGSNEELTKALQKISELEKAYSDLKKVMHDNSETQKKVNEEKKNYKKLTDDEIKSIEDLKKSLQGSVNEQMKAIDSIDVEKKSYNELNQIYNALKDSLNRMTTEQRNNSESGKAMTAQASKVYEAMKQLQQATGKTTLNVGNYAEATQSLKSQLRELTEEMIKMRMEGKSNTAEYAEIQKKVGNLKDAYADAQQEIKYLASDTSNLDVALGALTATGGGFSAATGAMKLFGAESEDVQEAQKKLQASMAIVNGLTAVQNNLQHQSALMLGVSKVQTYALAKAEELEGVVKAKNNSATWGGVAAQKAFNLVAKANPYALLATAILAVVGAIAALSKGLKALTSNMESARAKAKALKEVNEGAASSIGEMTAKFVALQKEWKNLKAEDMPKWLEQHKNDWNDVGISINDANDAEKLYVQNTSIIQDAIDKRARSIAAMKVAADKYEEAFKKQVESENAIAESSASTLDRIKQVVVGSSVSLFFGNTIGKEYVSREIKRDAEKYAAELKVEAEKLKAEALYIIKTFYLPEVDKEDQDKEAEKAKKEEEKSQKDANKKAEEANKKAEEARKKAEEARKKLESATRQLEDQIISNINDAFEREEKAEIKRHERFIEDRNAELKSVTKGSELYNVIKKQIEEEENTHNRKILDINRRRYEQTEKIQKEFQEKQYKIREEFHKKEMQSIVATLKEDVVYIKRRVRNVEEEELQNTSLSRNIEHLIEVKKKLMAIDIAYNENEAIKERTKLLADLNNQIKDYAQQISITQKLRQYGSISDIIHEFVDNNIGGQVQENIIGNILGEPAMKARIAGFQAENPENWETDYMNWLNDEFEEWGKQAMSAASTWYNTTKGYINDLINSYIELANAKANAAKESTDAAQKEYDKEKALLESGYAANVEATWAEYQEKKSAQEKAEADAKAAAQVQQELNETSTLGNLIVAASNIWKTFSVMGPVGVAAAVSAIGTMFAEFVAAKVKASEVSQYGEGGFEVLEGGSHASGHDIDLGVKNRKGRRMRAEGKEGLGIFSRRAMSHYGASDIEAMVNSVNRLEFEGNADKRMSLERSVGMAVLSAPRTDLHRVESDLHKLVGYGSRSRTVNADGSVTEIRKNAKIVYKNG